MKQKHLILILTGIIVLLAIGGISWYLIRVTGQDTYFTGVHVERVDFSGLTKEEAKEKFDQYWKELQNTEVEIKIGDDTEKMTMSSLSTHQEQL